MNIKGKLLTIGEYKQISDKFAVQPIVIETLGQYPKKVALRLVRKALDKALFLVEGATVSCEFDAESREYNGKWYTDLNCFEID